MITQRISAGALVLTALLASASVMASPARGKVGKFEVYADGAARVVKPADASGTVIAANSLDNARSGDGTLYGYRV